jgi:hypothetical protein
MPIYEFYCPDNNTIYSFFARSIACAGRTPRCPHDRALKLERIISTFAFIGRARETQATPRTPLDDLGLGRTLTDIGQEVSAWEESDPDPRRIASVMRGLSAAAGEKMSYRACEMATRMEAGEQPEKIEAEYGDLLGAPEESENESVTKRRGRGRQPSRPGGVAGRDPTLYDIIDYLDDY